MKPFVQFGVLHSNAIKHWFVVYVTHIYLSLLVRFFDFIHGF